VGPGWVWVDGYDRELDECGPIVREYWKVPWVECRKELSLEDIWWRHNGWWKGTRWVERGAEEIWNGASSNRSFAGHFDCYRQKIRGDEVRIEWIPLGDIGGAFL